MKSIFAIPALVLFSAMAASAGAQESPEDARALLERSASYIASLPAFTVDVEMSFQITGGAGESRSDTLTGSLAMAGEEKARFKVAVDEGTMELYYAPDSKYIYISEQQQYVKGTMFGERQQALSLMPGREFRAAQLLFTDFIHNDPSLLTEAEALEIVAPDASAGETIRIRVRGAGMQTDFWIRKGDKPLLEKFQMDLSEMAAATNPELSGVIITYTLANWNPEPALEDDHFTFKIPEGATEFQQAASQAAGPLEGKPAPQIQLELFEREGTLDLASHKGKNVVILDFWASWCGPCRIGLPIVSEVAAQFKDKNVVLYTVNVGEDPKLIEAFAEQMGLTAPIALDTDHTAQQKYNANSIPMTVIIDREGIVRRVHAGVSPSFKSDLTHELAELTK